MSCCDCFFVCFFWCVARIAEVKVGGGGGKEELTLLLVNLCC